MNKMNRKIEYGLMALKHMSHKRPGELTTAKEVADSYHAPFDATARVLQMMAHHGLLKVEHGALGGYVLTKDLNGVSLQDLIEIIQGPVKIAKCMHQNETCEIQSNCNIMGPVGALNIKLQEFYRSLTLAELLHQGSDKHGPDKHRPEKTGPEKVPQTEPLNGARGGRS
ncbi:MAG: Rrf2 family transcriptional regulator [Bdellovibrio sp.]|nr:MAG: Rrf2 family transcriptional regulator [Bdellovibrio sp.]